MGSGWGDALRHFFKVNKSDIDIASGGGRLRLRSVGMHIMKHNQKQDELEQFQEVEEVDDLYAEGAGRVDTA